MALPALVLVHGGRHAGDCWDLTVDEIHRLAPELTVLAVDLPGRRDKPGDLLDGHHRRLGGLGASPTSRTPGWTTSSSSAIRWRCDASPASSPSSAHRVSGRWCFAAPSSRPTAPPSSTHCTGLVAWYARRGARQRQGRRTATRGRAVDVPQRDVAREPRNVHARPAVRGICRPSRRRRCRDAICPTRCRGPGSSRCATARSR